MVFDTTCGSVSKLLCVVQWLTAFVTVVIVITGVVIDRVDRLRGCPGLHSNTGPLARRLFGAVGPVRATSSHIYWPGVPT